MSLRVGSVWAVCIGLLQLIGLVATCYVDHALWLPGKGIGLFEHPGMMSILVGDIVLFLLCVKSGSMSRKIGQRLPSNNGLLTRRYFRIYYWTRFFGKRRLFTKLFLFLSLVGAIGLANQTVRLSNPNAYYGHDTFDSWYHPYTFWLSRATLFTSWCVVIPLFFTYLLMHIFSISNFMRTCTDRHVGTFDPRHPDRCGGYAFYGWLDTIYFFGIAVVLFEATAMLVTHGRITIGSLSAIMVATAASILISFWSIAGVFRAVKTQERRLKRANFRKKIRSRSGMNIDYFAVFYEIKFSPYSEAALRLALVSRAAAAAPLVYKAIEYVISSGVLQVR